MTREQAIDKLRRLERVYTRALEVFVIAMVVIIVTIVSSQIYVRTVHNTSFTWSDELARLCLAWLTFVGAALVMQRTAHIRVDIISSVLSARSRAWLDFGMHLVMAVFLGVILVTGPNVIASAHSVDMSALPLPTSFMHAAPWGGALVILPYLIVNALRQLATARAGED